jgi:protein-S-isoprenylcysteine O-methyltransferase Ste14
MSKSKTLLNSAIVLYFVICLEILIMISPFAGFFYSAFNPVLLGLAKYPETRWLSSFFFTHLLVPPNEFLKFIRIMGSVLFVLGMVVFLICALQVYASKFLKTGPALKGLYSRIRHPQYLSLAVAGIGLAILWPRFLVVILWILMVLVYYVLGRDEERRMQKQHPETYPEYMKNSGMFLPKRVEAAVRFSTAGGKAMVFVVIAGLAVGGAFLLRDYTVHHLPLWSEANVTALPIVPGDQAMLEFRMGDILQLSDVKSRLDDHAAYLIYFLPPDYIMQGLLGDTGGDWQLYKRHHAMGMITDFIIHPFGHLSGGHHAGAGGHSVHVMNAGMSDMSNSMVRRLIFVKVSSGSGSKPSDVFAINAVRTPDFMIDLNVHELRIIDAKSLPAETAWARVPTPTF